MPSEYVKYMSALKRRADYLASRLVNTHREGRGASYDIVELRALQWAIRELSRGLGESVHDVGTHEVFHR